MRTNYIIFLIILLTSQEVFAKDTKEATLSVLRPILNSSLEKPELCLEFNHELNPLLREQNTTQLRLDSNDKPSVQTLDNVTITSSMFCLSSLEYHHDYHLFLSGVKGLQQEKMDDTYSINFTIPDRHPSLNFSTDFARNSVMHWGDGDPVLRSINISKAHIELYRIVSSDSMFEAWTKRQQAILAPTESVYLAHSHGELVWQDDIFFESDENKVLERKVQLSDLKNNFPPGLYLITALAPSVTVKPTDTGLAPQAANWLLKSNLTTRLVPTAFGYYVFSENYINSHIVSDVHISLLDADHHLIAQGTTNQDGMLFLPLSKEQITNTNVVMGQSPSGEISFSETNDNLIKFPVMPISQTILLGLKSIYSPSEAMNLVLEASDKHGKKTFIKGSNLEILRSDNSLYNQISVPDIEGESPFPWISPVINGEWTLNWKSAEGKILATNSFRTSSNPSVPKISIEADQARISSAGNINLLITSINEKGGGPAPFVSGRLNLNWINADNFFSNWDDYHFGRADQGALESKFLSSFITDSEGIAHVPINLIPPKNFSPAAAALLSVNAQFTPGVNLPNPLTIPITPNTLTIGVKPTALDGHFPENSIARFNIIALDSEGHRRDAQNLSYQVYNEGRNFEWYQSEGNWGYKPLQHLRRLGGKSIVISSRSDNIIEWPVTAGTYRIDIIDSDGNILNRYKFSAGWTANSTIKDRKDNLSLSVQPTRWQHNQKVSFKFKLDKDSTIFASVADDRIRQVWHQYLPKGKHELSFVPGLDWGDEIIAHVESNDVSGTTYLNSATDRNRNLDIHNQAQGHETSALVDINLSLPEQVYVGDKVNAILDINNSKVSDNSKLFSFSISNGPRIRMNNVNGTFDLAQGHHKNITTTLSAIRPGSEEIKVDVLSPDNIHIVKIFTINIVRPNQFIQQLLEFELKPKETKSIATIEKSHSIPENEVIFLDNIPFANSTNLLSAYLNNNYFTSSDLARYLRVLIEWEQVITNSALMSDIIIKEKKNEIVLSLINRQNLDGGFPNFPGNESDYVTTAEVLLALHQSSLPSAKIALEHAQNWLKHRLENTWFEESERSDRASMYAALAITGDVDKSSLNFFSDTSLDKALTPIAKAQLALAFFAINDHDKSTFWLNSIHFDNISEVISSDVLPLLASNGFFRVEDTLKQIVILSKKFSLGTTTDIDIANLLISRSLLNHNNTEWRYAENGSEKSAKAIHVILADSRSTNISNPNNNLLYGLLSKIISQNTAAQPDVKTITRSIYNLDGTLIENGSTLDHNETYLVVLQIPLLNTPNKQPLIVFENLYPFLTPLGCTIDGQNILESKISWINQLNLSTASSCENHGTKLTWVYKFVEDSKDNQLKFAYFAKTSWGGVFKIKGATGNIGSKLVVKENVKSSYSAR